MLGNIKIGDFGLAKIVSKSHPQTNEVMTRWYRAPELLYGATTYEISIDLWAAGCILGELLLNTPLFRGESDVDQLSKIFQVLGRPTKETWPVILPFISYLKLSGCRTTSRLQQDLIR